MGGTGSVGLELGLEPSRPTSRSSAWLPQLPVSETWSVVLWGLRLGTAGCGREGGGVLLTSGVTVESSPRPRALVALGGGSPVLIPRKLFCGWWVLGSSAGVLEPRQPPPAPQNPYPVTVPGGC